MEQRPVNSEFSIKEEIDIAEWEMPVETAMKVPEAAQHFQEADEDDYNDIEPDDVEPVELPEEEYEEKCNAQVFCQPLQESTGSSDLKNCLSLEASQETVGNSFEGESSSICTSQDIYDRNRDTNKGIHENYLRCDVVPVEESLSTQISKSILNVTKSGRSNLKASLTKRKSGESEKGTNKRLYSCVLCAKNFSSRSGLYLHSNLHSNKYKCNYCGRSCGDNAGLKRHLRTHTKEKPFKCEVCLKCFSAKSNMNSHLLIHSSERPHLCEICDKGFRSKQEKITHALYHLRKK